MTTAQAIQTRRIKEKRRIRAIGQFRQRLIGLALVVLPFAVTLSAYTMGVDKVDMTFAIIPWLMGGACLGSKKCVLVNKLN